VNLSRVAWTRFRAAPALLLVVVSRTLVAQIPTNEVSTERVVTPREEMEQEVAASRYRLGPVRLTPGLYIADATYDNNVYGSSENPVGDFRVTIAAGLGLIAPVTPNIFIRATVLPAYTWYATLQERRFFGGQYGGSFLIFANRLTVEGGGGYSRQDVLYSTENQQRVIQNLATVGLGAELQLLRRLYLYGGGRIQGFQYTGAGAPGAVSEPSTTDRTTYLVRAELRYKWLESFMIAAGAEETKAEFVYTPGQYDNRTRAIIGSLSYQRPAYFIHFFGGYRDGTPIHGSTIPPFAGFTGGGYASYSFFRWLDVNASGGRTLSYGISSPYYVVTRYGGGVVFNIGWRLKLRGFGNLGDDSYTTLTLLPDGRSVYRKDDVTDYGGGLEFLITSRLRLSFLGTESRYNSNVPGTDRSFFRWFVSLGFGGNLLQ
jgi:hypothetical protein